eukprot:TRINITY_DN13708_c1_g1_i1.p1 TRINITY_DN13708_c1_g1~~TRINITY_DN13708_c1_g1_i1.p1  ORF type:complete len:418 (+),score=161.71 TRINITY_DN13708_c1_g1_i1:102-1256(+)
MADWEDNPAVVLDNGTGMMKAGFAGQEEPGAVFPAAVSRKRGVETALVGDDAVGKAGYRIKYPVEHGIVNNWDDMALVWRKAYEELDVEPGNQGVLVTEAPLNPRKNREKMLEVLFDDFGVPACYIQIQAVLSLMASGRNDGVVIDSGDGVTHAVPVFDGRVVPTAVKRSEIAGRDLTEWMQELLNEDQDFRFSSSLHKEWVKEIKEKFCYIEDDFDSALEKWNDENDCFDDEHTLPDGTSIKVGRAKFCCPEAIFNPGLMEREEPALHDLLFNSVWDCPIDTRKTLLSNIVLSGGSTLFKGMESRLTKEMKNHPKLPEGAREIVKVVSDASDDGRNIRKYTVWMGGAVLASLGTFQEHWITKEEYEEHGPDIVHQRCDSLSGY